MESFSLSRVEQAPQRKSMNDSILQRLRRWWARMLDMVMGHRAALPSHGTAPALCTQQPPPAHSQGPLRAAPPAPASSPCISVLQSLHRSNCWWLVTSEVQPVCGWLWSKLYLIFFFFFFLVWGEGFLPCPSYIGNVSVCKAGSLAMCHQQLTCCQSGERKNIFKRISSLDR